MQKSTWLVGLLLLAAPAGAAEFQLTAAARQGSEAQELMSWSLSDLAHLKKISSREKDPRGEKVVRWEGVALSQLIELALKNVPAERKAQIDLIILKGEGGAQALIPRAFTVKYPMMLALRSERGELPAEIGPIYSVAPWTSKSKAMQEGVPLESFFVAKVNRIEFANYQDRYGGIFLKRRTDPAAMRGEKLFVQSCVACHGAGRGPSVQEISSAGSDPKSRTLASAGHPPSSGSGFKLTERDLRSLLTYLEAHRAEAGNAAPAASGGTAPAAAGGNAPAAAGGVPGGALENLHAPQASR